MAATRHYPSGERNVFIHSLPRSGSTWLMELILTQPGFMSCNEPLNLRKEAVRDQLGMYDWAELHDTNNKSRIYEYFEGIQSGRLRDPRFHRRMPFSTFYRPITHRIVFKIINAGEEHINWLASTFNGGIVFLLRHPVPVALSRALLPKLRVILTTDVRHLLSDSQLRFSANLMRTDNHFSLALLDWCIRNAIALKSRTDDWTVVTYEQLVQDPVPVVDTLTKRLHLPKPNRILKRLSVASRSTRLSDPRTRDVLHSGQNADKKRWLLEKWRQQTSESDLDIANELLDIFELSDIYNAKEALPSDKYWIR